MEQIECSEMSAYKIEMPGNYPKENILYFLIKVLYSMLEVGQSSLILHTLFFKDLH